MKTRRIPDSIAGGAPAGGGIQRAYEANVIYEATDSTAGAPAGGRY